MDIIFWLLIVVISASGGCAIGLFWAGAKMLERETDAYEKGWKAGRQTNEKGWPRAGRQTKKGDIMIKSFISFLIFLFGIMAGYGWQHYHNGLRITELKKEIAENQKLVDAATNTGWFLEQKIEEIEKDLQGKKAYEMEVKTTGYCNNPICINDVRWQDGMTATGTKARLGVCASDWEVLPVGTLLYVDGYGFCTVEDRGGKVKGKHIDLFFNSYNEAKQWGMKKKKILIFL